MRFTNRYFRTFYSKLTIKIIFSFTLYSLYMKWHNYSVTC